MKNGKAIVHVLLSVFLAYQSYNLYYASFYHAKDLNQFESIALAVICNLFVTGTFAFIGFSFPTSKVLPKSYYIIHKPKRIDFWYRVLGVKYFRYFLLSTFWKNKTQQKSFFNGTKSGLDQFIYSSHQAEFGHIGAFVIIQVYMIIMAFKTEYLLLLYGSIINIFFNLYPVLLQRKHRIRIQRILQL